jgi:bifunctional non-homologous end joining protein LigD
MPVSWAELKSGLSPLDFNIHNALKKIKKQPGLFKGVLGKGISMQLALKKLKALDDMQ